MIIDYLKPLQGESDGMIYAPKIRPEQPYKPVLCVDDRKIYVLDSDAEEFKIYNKFNLSLLNLVDLTEQSDEEKCEITYSGLAIDTE